MDVTGDVSDPQNALTSWKLSLVPFGDGAPKVIATGASPVSGTLGQLDPTLLANGSYTLRLEAANAANWIKTRPVQKLGRRRSGRGGGRNSASARRR